MPDGVFQYFAVYRTNILTLPAEVIRSSQIQVELVRGPKKFTSMRRRHRILAPNGFTANWVRCSIDLPADGLFLVIVSTVPVTPDANQIKNIGYDLIDEAVAILAAVHNPDMLDGEIFRGVLLDNDPTKTRPFTLESQIHVAQKFLSLESNKTTKLLEDIPITLDTATRKRLGLMGKQYARALQAENDEERFLALWIVLEVHPMRATDKIIPIVKMIEKVTGFPYKECEAKMMVNKLRRTRADIVHDGGMLFGDGVMGELFAKLDLLAITAIRDLIGMEQPSDLQNHIRAMNV
jgi:hypothetical protein